MKAHPALLSLPYSHHNTPAPPPTIFQPLEHLALPPSTQSADSFRISDKSLVPCLPASEHTPTLHCDILPPWGHLVLQLALDQLGDQR